jgi:molybdopterin-guanine dinucleotide biosynthesis protein A
LRSAIILAGGEAKRAGGREKYRFEYEGIQFIRRLIISLSEVTDEIVVVARDEKHCNSFQDLTGVTIVCDIRKNIGPLGGIHAGIKACTGELIFVTACDMPCIHPEVVARLFNSIDGHEAVIPKWNEEMIEPLHAVYRRSALTGYLEEHKSLSIRSLIRSIDASYVDAESFRDIDPDLETFMNINSLEELENINGTTGK